MNEVLRKRNTVTDRVFTRIFMWERGITDSGFAVLTEADRATDGTYLLAFLEDVIQKKIPYAETDTLSVQLTDHILKKY